MFATGLWQACQQVVTMLLFHQGCHSELVDRVVELQDDSKLLEELVTSCQQAVNKLGTSSANTSCFNVLKKRPIL